MHVRTLLTAASVVLLGPLATARAQFPGLTATFLQPAGSVLPTDPIDIFVHLMLDPNASPLDFDGNSPGTLFGLPASLFAGSNLASYTNAYTTAGLSSPLCIGSGSPTCTASSAYTFSFATSAVPQYYFLDALSIAPGGTLDFLFGTFTPQAGGAPSGTYTFNGASAALIVNGLDGQGQPALDVLFLAQACAGQSAATCEFTQVVQVAASAVPEPTSIALVVTGLVGLVGVARRRRSA